MYYLRFLTLIIAASVWIFLPEPAYAGEADVVFAKFQRGTRNLYRFDVTVKHADSGWEHYANKWEVLDPNGKILGVRKLLHPHEDEQPFTRSLSGVKIPKDLSQVIIRAHDSQHGYGGKVFKLKLR